MQPAKGQSARLASMAAAGRAAAEAANLKAAAAAEQAANAASEAAAEAAREVSGSSGGTNEAETAEPPEKKARTEDAPAAAPAAANGCPQLPQEMVALGSRRYIKPLVPYVDAELPKFLKAKGILSTDEPMPARKPLHIDSADMRSFKESWNPTNCCTSLRETLMYEAGGNLCWIDGEFEKQVLPTEDPPLKWMPEFEESGFFSFKGRVKFPVVMECHVEKPFGDTVYPTTVLPIGGHAYLYAWYYSAWKALRDANVERCQELYICALTTTLCVRVSGSVQDLAELSTKFSERVRSDAQVVIDSFLTFADKVLVMTDQKPELKALQEKKSLQRWAHQHEHVADGQLNRDQLDTLLPPSPFRVGEQVRA